MIKIQKHRLLLLSISTLLMAGCDSAVTTDTGVSAGGNSAASSETVQHNREVLQQLPFGDTRDFDEANRGLVVAADDLIVKHSSSDEIIWDMPAYDFIEGEAPDTVNPSLWRQAKLNNTPGLYLVKEGIWQLRNFDLATVTIIEGETGWIVVDPNTTIETGKAAQAFLQQHLFKEKPVTTVLFTHSHIDHFGGAAAFISDQDYQSGKVTVVAPEGFIEEASSENIMLGNAMTRRAGYQYGSSLTPGPRGNVDLGLGKSVPFGTTSLFVPNKIIKATGETHTFDGVEFVFQIASGTEAPAEFTFYLPQHNAFCGAEVISRTLHNVYTLRGAKVRDALLWSEVIDDMLQHFGDADVIFNSHHWPIWGQERIRDYLESQRDTYKFIHDQTVHMILNGMTPNEIANAIRLPEALSQHFYSRGYYGTLQHNAKAVYQYYMGWYDGNPANLHPLPLADTAAKYIELMGGIDTVVTQAQRFYDQGEYQWVAELLNKAVFAKPKHKGARELLANTYDQMAYQAESGPWRSEYLTAAHELRHGITAPLINIADAKGLLTRAPISTFLETIAVNIDAKKADGKAIVIELVFTDVNEAYVLSLKNSVLHFYQRPLAPKQALEPSATLTLTKSMLLTIITGTGDLKSTLLSDDLSVDGSFLDLLSFFGSMSGATENFPIITP